MRKWIILFLLLLAFVSANDTYDACCCTEDGFSEGGEGFHAIELADCPAGTVFTQLTYERFQQLDQSERDQISEGKACTMMCKKFGPGITETNVTQGCGSPGYAPEVYSINTFVGKGVREITLTWDTDCSTFLNLVNIERCKGDECNDFQLIASVGRDAASFTDKQLEWNNEYTYRMSAEYFSGISNSVTISKYLGDIECDSVFDTDSFCVNIGYYARLNEYLKEYSMPGLSSSAFNKFDDAVYGVFASKLNNAYYCDNDNLIHELLECNNQTVCAIRDEYPVCINKVDCKEGISEPLGLYSTQTLCEGQNDPRYCFYDKSFSHVNDCFACRPEMKCADYLSEGACLSDNCGLGSCTWNPLFEDLGIGVCVNTKQSNCEFCDFKGTEDLREKSAFNEIFDSCTNAKAKALSTEKYQCFYDVQEGTAKSCDTAACTAFSEEECGMQHIQLNNNNVIQNPSPDPCGIRSCEWNGIRCVKNRDGHLNVLDDVADCAEETGKNRDKCEQDHFDPITSIKPIGSKPGRHDKLEIEKKDKKTSKGEYSPAEIPLYYCAYAADGSPCTEYRETYSTNITIQDQVFGSINIAVLLEGDVLIQELKTGENIIRYFSKDEANNVEEVKETSFLACVGCHGPNVIGVNFSKSQIIDEIVYTRVSKPNIKVHFDEDATLTVYQIKQPGERIGLDIVSSDPKKYLFRPSNSLEDGEYSLQINSMDESGTLQDEVYEQRFIVDTTTGDLEIRANNETEENKLFRNAEVLIELFFDESVIIDSATISTLNITNYISNIVKDNLSELKTGDNKYYATRVLLDDGPHTVEITARDYAGNEIEESYTFVVGATNPKILLSKPSFGVADSGVFTLEAQTLAPAECGFFFDPLTPVSYDELESFFDTGGIVHSEPNFNRIFEPEQEFIITIGCKDALDRETIQNFEISYDTTPALIKSAYATPDPIIQAPLVTELVVETDDETFCRYSSSSKEFSKMEGEFPGFYETGLRVHRKNISVSGAASYQYKVACMNLAESYPAERFISFSVNKNMPLILKSHTPKVSNQTTVQIAIETNKMSRCCYKPEGGTRVCDSAQSIDHINSMNAEEGLLEVEVTCQTTGDVVIDGIPEKITIVERIIIDTSPPEMVYVSDNSTLMETPDISYFQNKLRIRFLAKDNESEISKYFVNVLDDLDEPIAENLSFTSIKGDRPFYITRLNLSNNTEYHFVVRAKNEGGLFSIQMESDGVTVDFSAKPDSCSNGEIDRTEVDVDCGSRSDCGPCIAEQKCAYNDDCLSGNCDSVTKTCEQPRCDDGILNGDESDTDCGADCPSCKIGERCTEDRDCGNQKCTGGTCGYVDTCENGVIDGTEADVDCGGSCPSRCNIGKQCRSDNDCKSGKCISDNGVMICSSDATDTDGDGILDADEIANGLDPENPDDAEYDNDGDGLSNKEEITIHETDPNKKDTDDDGFTDPQEINQGTDPLDFGSFPDEIDSDGDEISDLYEDRFGLDKNNPGDADLDFDGDGLSNLEEYLYSKQYGIEIDPNDNDSDGDGWTDKEEIDAGTDPMDSESKPKSKVLFWIIVILILVLVGVVGYLVYIYIEELHQEHKNEFKPVDTTRQRLTKFFSQPIRRPLRRRPIIGRPRTKAKTAKKKTSHKTRKRKKRTSNVKIDVKGKPGVFIQLGEFNKDKFEKSKAKTQAQEQAVKKLGDRLKKLKKEGKK